MNSMSRPHCNDDSHKEIDCCRKHKETEVLLKCGTPGSITLPVITVAPASFPLTSLTLNTAGLCNPCIKFEFASNIITPATAVVTINFQIFKLCRNQLTPTPVGGVWTFSRILNVGGSDTFTFIVCDCDVCPDDCCTYSVVATLPVINVGITTITNATLSALVVENNCHCC